VVMNAELSSPHQLTASAPLPSFAHGMHAFPTEQQFFPPTRTQLHEQAFSLTPAQYNDLSNDSPLSHLAPRRQRSARSVGELLSTNGHADNPAITTYTRSLLKDKVSTQVLRDFAHMISQTNRHQIAGLKPEDLD